MPETVLQSVDFYYTNPAENSDKVYLVRLIQDDQGFRVDCANGKRGGSLKLRPKGAGLSQIDAEALYDKVCRERLKNGYTTDVSGTPFAPSTDVRSAPGASAAMPVAPKAVELLDRGLVMLSEIDRVTLMARLLDPSWRLEQKIDGERRPVRRVGADMTGFNKNRLAVAFSSTVRNALLELSTEAFLVDGEEVGETYYPFDLIEVGGASIAHLPYQQRLEHLDRLLQGADARVIKRVPGAQTAQAKDELLAMIEARKLEGVVAKDLRAPYEGFRGEAQGKYKLYETVTVICGGQNGVKRSVSIFCLDDAGSKVAIGNVTIPPNVAMPQDGSLIEVRYLYRVGPQGDLFQPTFDKPRPDCILADVVRNGAIKLKPQTQDFHALAA